MSADQAAKLAHPFILLINAFLHLVNENKEKTYACHLISETVSKTVRK